MRVVSPNAHPLRWAPQRWRPLVVLWILASVGPGRQACAQEVAKVNAIVRVVRTAPPGGAQFRPARLGTPLPAGGRVRTGGRSRAGVQFPNKSVLRLDELTEVVIAGARETDVRVLGGRIFAEYTRPATITGGYATAAVRGTQVIFFEDVRKKTAYIRCYDGSVFVTPPNSGARAGSAASGSTTTLVDPELAGAQAIISGYALRFVTGPHQGQQCTVTGFEAATGTVTFTPALPAAVQAGDGYLLVADSQVRVAQLAKNQGITVVNGSVSGEVYRIAPLAFAEGERYPWHLEVVPGIATRTYPGTLAHQVLQLQENAIETGIQTAIQDPNPANPTTFTGDLVVIVDPGAAMAQGARAGRLQSSLRAEGGGGASAPRPGLLGGLGGLAFGQPSNAEGGRGLVLPRRDPEYPPTPSSGRGPQFSALPFFVGSSEGHAVGAELRAQAVLGNVLTAVAGRAADYDGHGHVRLSEAFAHLRTDRFEVLLGRQPFFLGPANNSDLARLLGFDTIDAAILRTARGKAYRQELGYVLDTNPLFRRGYSGFYTRGEGSLGKGIFGWQLLTATIGGADLGWSLDGSYPLIENALDLYAEGGVDPLGNRVIMAGIYLPGVFQRTRLDVFAEYHHREELGERLHLRVRRRVGRNLFLLAFVQQNLDTGETDGGGALQYAITFR